MIEAGSLVQTLRLVRRRALASNRLQNDIVHEKQHYELEKPIDKEHKRFQ